MIYGWLQYNCSRLGRIRCYLGFRFVVYYDDYYESLRRYTFFTVSRHTAYLAQDTKQKKNAPGPLRPGSDTKQKKREHLAQKDIKQPNLR